MLQVIPTSVEPLRFPTDSLWGGQGELLPQILSPGLQGIVFPDDASQDQSKQIDGIASTS